MRLSIFIKIILLGVLLMANPFTAEVLGWGDRIKSFFADKPLSHPFSSSKPENQRGNAQQTRPDIHVPPPPDAAAGQESPAADETKFNQMISGLENIAGVASQGGLEGLPVQPHRPQDAANKVRWAPPPPGFLTAETFNYLIYRETNPVTPTIRQVLDNIHGNLMLDLTPFTILIKPNKILVMLFGQQKSYMEFTNLPSWSGASSDLRADTMYVIEGNSFYGLSVHELTHLYFDGYFLPTISPLWLSEGMAVYMQVHATKQPPSWIDQGLREIVAGRIIPLETMTVTEDLSSYPTDKAGLWYTQAYSLVDYLLNTRTRDEFYKFCNELKAKTPLHQALYRAYGMPFNKVSALENVWLHDIQKAYREGKILQAPPASAMMIASPAPAAPPARKPATPSQPTQINKLQKVPTNSYTGGF